MRRILAVILTALTAIGIGACGSAQKSADSYLEGKGTIEKPYLIRSVDDLEWLSIQVNSGTEFEGVFFRQENDLDFSDYGNWVPIGGTLRLMAINCRAVKRIGRMSVSSACWRGRCAICA